MKEKGIYKICEGIEDLNIKKYWYMLTMKMDWEMRARMLTLIPGEDPKNVDETYQKQKKIMLTESQVNGYFDKTYKSLKVIFPEEFETDDLQLNTLKEILRLQLMLISAKGWNRADLQEALRTQLELMQEMMAASTALENWKSFETLCYLLSKADGVSTVDHLQSLSVYGFYMHKTQAQAYLEKEKNRIQAWQKPS